MKRVAGLVSVVLLAILSSTPYSFAVQGGSRQSAVVRFDSTEAAVRITRFLADTREAWDAPAISATVAVGDRVVYSAGVGYANLEEKNPATGSTVYRIASTSKVITATAILQLVESGRVAFDDDIREYVPEFPQKEWPITVRQVLTHTSGIRHYNPGETSRKREHYDGVAEAISLFKDDPLRFRPGTRYGYTTFGYTLLQGVVEAASGLRYVDYLRENVFAPAGMADSDLEYAGRVYPKRAVGYRKNLDQIEPVGFDDVSFKFAGGGMLSSTMDLVHLCMALGAGKLLSSEMVSEMFSEQIPDLDPGNGYAWGIRVEEEAGLKRAWHPGRSFGFESYLLCYPDEGVYVSVLTNQQYTNPWSQVGGLAGFLANLYLPGGVTEAGQIPDRTLSSAVRVALETGGDDAALRVYREYLENPAYRDRDTESEINQLGYVLLGTDRLEEAIAVFEVNVEAHPDAANAHDSLGEAYMAAGDEERSEASYKRSLQLAPENENAARLLEKLRASREPRLFEPAGTYELTSTVDVNAQEVELLLTVELAETPEGAFEGSIATNLFPQLVITSTTLGGNQLWVTAATPDGPFELHLILEGSLVSGAWYYGPESRDLQGAKVE